MVSGVGLGSIWLSTFARNIFTEDKHRKRIDREQVTLQTVMMSSEGLQSWHLLRG